MKLLTTLFLCALVTMVSGCRKTPTSDLVVGTGTITTGLGDCRNWFVKADDGQAYEVTRLGPEFQQSGLRVGFTLRERNDVASICMAGTIVDVISMKKL